jgi:hypothetical protein
VLKRMLLLQADGPQCLYEHHKPAALTHPHIRECLDQLALIGSQLLHHHPPAMVPRPHLVS